MVLVCYCLESQIGKVKVDVVLDFFPPSQMWTNTPSSFRGFTDFCQLFCQCLFVTISVCCRISCVAQVSECQRGFRLLHFGLVALFVVVVCTRSWLQFQSRPKAFGLVHIWFSSVRPPLWWKEKKNPLVSYLIHVVLICLRWWLKYKITVESLPKLLLVRKEIYFEDGLVAFVT